MITIAALALLLVMAEQSEARQDILNAIMNSPPDTTSQWEPIPPSTEAGRLDELYNLRANSINQVLTSTEFSPSEKALRLESLEPPSRNEDTIQYLIKTCKEAFAKSTIEWKTLRKVFFVAESGYNDETLVEIAIRIVSFHDSLAQGVSEEQIASTLAAITLLARLDWPGRDEFFINCADGSLWKNSEIICAVRSDLKKLLQNHAILNVAALPNDKALIIFENLELLYPADLFLDGADDGAFALSVAILKADLERKKLGLPAIIQGMR